MQAKPAQPGAKPAATEIPHMIEEKVVKFNGETFTRKYLKGKFLGKGGFAKCYEFNNLENKRVSAAKVIQKSSLTKSRAK